MSADTGLVLKKSKKKIIHFGIFIVLIKTPTRTRASKEFYQCSCQFISNTRENCGCNIELSRFNQVPRNPFSKNVHKTYIKISQKVQKTYKKRTKNVQKTYIKKKTYI